MYELVTLGTCDLRHADGRSVQSVLAQPKRLALLAALALARPRGFVRRDVLLPLFWPELDEDRARAALRRAVYFLRQALGRDAVVGRGDDELGLGDGVIRCDAIVFQALLDSGDAAGALQLYGGDLLPGLNLNDAPEFERWLDTARERLRRGAIEAAWLAAEQAERAGVPNLALERARRAVELSQKDEIALRRLLAMHQRIGDARGGLAAFDAYRRQLHEEYGIAPSAELAAQAQALAESGRGEGGPTRLDIIRARKPFTDAATRALSRVPRRPLVRHAGTAVLGAVLLLGLYAFVRYRERADRVVMAVGAVRDFTGDTASPIARAVPDLLATNLARMPELHLVSIARLYELLGSSSSEPGALAAAARSAGATELIEGALYRVRGGYRLDIREVQLDGGDVKQVFSVEAADVFALVDRATARLGRGTAELRVAEVTTPSAEAWSLYQEGLRTQYQHGDVGTANSLYHSAIEHDSSFAMAYYYASTTEAEGVAGFDLLVRAAELADRASDHDRLLIKAQLAYAREDPHRLAIAETLAVRYPTDPDGLYMVGNALLWSGDLLGSIPYFRRVIAMDSLGLRGDQARCRGCEAYSALGSAYLFADSIEAALRVARTLTAIKPASHSGWEFLLWAAQAAGLLDEALLAGRRLSELSPSWGGAETLPIDLALRAGDFAAAQASIQPLARSARPGSDASTLWFGTMTGRYTGRLHDALTAAKAYRRLGARGNPEPLPDYEALLEGIVLFEMGRYRESAALFDSIAARARKDRDPRMAPRKEVWVLAHAANALAYAGDTAALAARIPVLRSLGAQSAYGRDQKLHYHALGLLLRARGDLGGAAEAFRQGIFSPTVGYTRTNYELARTLLELGRPADAVTTLTAALQGGLHSSNLYLTHTDLHALIGQAYEQLGQADSARVNYEWAVRAWEHGEPRWQARRAALQHRLRNLR